MHTLSEGDVRDVVATDVVTTTEGIATLRPGQIVDDFPSSQSSGEGRVPWPRIRGCCPHSTISQPAE